MTYQEGKARGRYLQLYIQHQDTHLAYVTNIDSYDLITGHII